MFYTLRPMVLSKWILETWTLPEDDYLNLIKNAGFIDIQVKGEAQSCCSQGVGRRNCDRYQTRGERRLACRR